VHHETLVLQRHESEALLHFFMRRTLKSWSTADQTATRPKGGRVPVPTVPTESPCIAVVMAGSGGIGRETPRVRHAMAWPSCIVRFQRP
jgi:hypothetical protein